MAKGCTIIPLAIFFLLGMVFNTEPREDGMPVYPPMYLALVVARVVLMGTAIFVFAREIGKQFPLKTDYLGWAVGLLGAVLWIGICHLQLESSAFRMLGLPDRWIPARDGVDPFAIYDAGLPLIGFLVMRFALLVLCVPIAEELFLRGFLMRAVEAEDWTDLPLKRIGRMGLIAGTVYGVASHPGEIVAAAVWFSLVTLLMVRTGKFWNCVLAHAVTNLILGIYVCLFSQWHLW